MPSQEATGDDSSTWQIARVRHSMDERPVTTIFRIRQVSTLGDTVRFDRVDCAFCRCNMHFPAQIGARLNTRGIIVCGRCSVQPDQ